MNCKVVSKLIEGESDGVFAAAALLTADDGSTAVELLRSELSAGRAVHFVLMDFIMVCVQCVCVCCCCWCMYGTVIYWLHALSDIDHYARARGGPHHARGTRLPRGHHRYA